MTRICKVCAQPLATDETIARVLLAAAEKLALAPELPEEAATLTLPELLAFIHNDVRPRLTSVAAELVGVHLRCRLDEAGEAAGVRVEAAPGTEAALGPVQETPARRGLA